MPENFPITAPRSTTTLVTSISITSDWHFNQRGKCGLFDANWRSLQHIVLLWLNSGILNSTHQNAQIHIPTFSVMEMICWRCRPRRLLVVAYY